jgi:hypothetical protein
VDECESKLITPDKSFIKTCLFKRKIHVNPQYNKARLLALEGICVLRLIGS